MKINKITLLLLSSLLLITSCSSDDNNNIPSMQPVSKGVFTDVRDGN